MSLPSEITEKLIDRLAMLHGDSLENIAGTRLFVPHERKAISRAAIEHALLTSTQEECSETLKVGALMIAIGAGVLTLPELRELGHHLDCNSFGLSHEEQVQTGLHILNLIPGLIEGDQRLQNVLRAYSQDALTVEGIGLTCVTSASKSTAKGASYCAAQWKESTQRGTGNAATGSFS